MHDVHAGTAVEVWEASDGSGNMIAMDSSLSPQDVMTAARMAAQGGGIDGDIAKVVSVMDAAWGQNGTGGSPKRLGGVLDRDAYLAPTGTFHEMRTARKALKDDVVGNGADITEAFALSAVKMFTADLDEQDAWNQWAGLVDMDTLNRKLWRVLYTDSQFVAVTWWDRQSFKVRGKGEGGAQRRKTFDLVCPVAVSTLDTTKVVPVGTMMFGQEQLAYIAEPDEAARFDAILRRRDDPGSDPSMAYLPVSYGDRMLTNASGGGIDPVDPIVRRLITRRYRPTRAEQARLRAEGVENTRHLFLLDQRFAFRHTLTKPDHVRFADVRLASLFSILDRKQQLEQMDRAFLIGGTNYIIVITKGTDNDPASAGELKALRANATKIGQFPLITGDHRLHVEIVTPKLDVTLDEKKYDTLDKRLYARVFGTFTTTGSSGEDPLALGRVIGTGLESRRRMLRRALERNIIEIMRLSNPDQLTGKAKMVFSPDKISMAFDSAWATFITGLLNSKHISRETALSQFGLDQSHEAAWREREEELFDPIFQSIVPFSEGNNDPANPISPAQRQEQAKAGGRSAGGNNNGGGRAPGSQQGKKSIDPGKSKTGPTRMPKAAAATADEVLDAIAGRCGEGRLAVLLQGDDERKRVSRPHLKTIAGHFDIPGRHQMRTEDLVMEIIDAYDDQLEAEDAQEGQ